MIQVLLAEDEPRILRDLESLIPRLNDEFVIVGAYTNGKQLLQALPNLTPDVLITDIQMPVYTGLELIEYMNVRDMPVLSVIISSYENFTYAKKAVSLHVFEYLLKPIDEDELLLLLLKISETVNTRQFQNKKKTYYCVNKDTSEAHSSILCARIEKYLLEHYTENINQQTLATTFNYVAPYISRIFKKEYGCSPTTVLTRIRVQKAGELIRQNPAASGSAIARAVGFDDPLYLSKVFKRETGMSLSDFKQSLH